MPITLGLLAVSSWLDPLCSLGWNNTWVNCVLWTPFLYAHVQPVVLNEENLLGKIKNLKKISARFLILFLKNISDGHL